MRILLRALLLLLLFTRESQAEISGAESLEWLSCNAEVVVIGRLTAKSTMPNFFKGYTIEIEEVLKGDIKDSELGFFVRTSFSYSVGRDILPLNQRLLLFLSISKNNGSSHCFLDDSYIPTSKREPLSVVNLTSLSQKIYTKDLVILTEPEDVLDIARTWSKSGITKSIWSAVPHSSPIHRDLFAGSGCYLTVPAEEKFRAGFMKMAESDHPTARQRGASELGKFPGDETERVLRELLKDDTENYWYSAADTISNVEFSVRAAAYRSLVALGKEVPKIRLERRPTELERRTYRHAHWKKSFSSALTEGWDVIAIEDVKRLDIGVKEIVSLLLTCSNGKDQLRFTLVPKGLNSDIDPAGELMGINGRNTSREKYFYVDGRIPEELKKKLTKRYGLR